MNILSLVKNIVKVGKINSIDASKGTVSVLFPDYQNLISDNLPLLSSEYKIPKIGSSVLCIFLGNGLEQGFCLGEFYSNINTPKVNDENIFQKNFDDGTFIRFNNSTKVLELTSPVEIVLNCDVKIYGQIVAQDFIKGV